MKYDEERKIRTEERKRAVKIFLKYQDGTPGSVINIIQGIHDGWETKESEELKLYKIEVRNVLEKYLRKILPERLNDIEEVLKL